MQKNQLDRKFLELLTCPLSHASLGFNEQTNELICKASKLAYPVRDGIPIMLPSEARQLDEAEIQALGKT